MRMFCTPRSAETMPPEETENSSFPSGPRFTEIGSRFDTITTRGGARRCANRRCAMKRVSWAVLSPRILASSCCRRFRSRI
jgi:hypothetical protein